MAINSKNVNTGFNFKQELKDMNSEVIPYHISPSEMERRKKAYTTLIIALFFGVFLSTIHFLTSYLLITISVLAGIAILLILSRQLLFKTFKQFEKTKVFLNDTYIERKTGTSYKQCYLNMIVGLWVKRTINGTIREIKIKFDNKRQLSITALQDFDNFNNQLQKSVSKNTLISEFKEPIDYDHPFFYILFGFITGIITTNGLRLLLLIDYNVLKWIQRSIIVFIFGTGIYWFFNRPIYRYGMGKSTMDYFFSIFLLLTGIALIISTFL